jgi:hypothetical protein
MLDEAPDEIVFEREEADAFGEHSSAERQAPTTSARRTSCSAIYSPEPANRLFQHPASG